ncbi:MAG TPA: prepilin-type N-terminal cleavage/methylation domain-containing protein [Candidatus Hydrogenedentes bacterium]|nr:prepilin-type N-terminal cleavage/methylation domain-containing protein [Candidatus Hydrogenedentota bacterium]
MTARASRHRLGFTLLELMVAISILTVIVTIIYISFSSVTRASEVARDVAENLRLHQFLLRHFNQVIPTLHADAAVSIEAYQVLGEDASGPMGPADKLRFCSSTPLMGGKSLPGVFKVVTFEVMDESAEEGGGLTGIETEEPDQWNDRGALALEYRESPLTVDMNAEGDQMLGGFDATEQEYASWRVPVSSFDVTYFDGEEWITEWNSLDKGLIPWAITIRINFSKSEADWAADRAAGITPEEDPDFEMSYVLPAGAGTREPFLDLNPAATAQAERDLFRREENRP